MEDSNELHRFSSVKPGSAQFVDTIRTSVLSGKEFQSQGHADFFVRCIPDCENCERTNILDLWNNDDLRREYSDALDLFTSSVSATSCRIRNLEESCQCPVKRQNCDNNGNELGLRATKPSQSNYVTHKYMIDHARLNLCGMVHHTEWEARDPRRRSSITSAVNNVFIHHTTGPACNNMPDCKTRVKQTQNYHMNNKGDADIGYSFLVGEDGNVYEGRGWGVVGAHTEGYNSKSYGIAFIGDFTSRVPSNQAIWAAQDIISCGVSKGHICSNYSLRGHRDVVSTASPGNDLYNQIKTWPNYG